jgi:phosphate acetyltransferase
VPDIVSGNALFKALVYLSGGCAAGIVMGASVPILLTSRADPPAARLASAALAAICRKAG